MDRKPILSLDFDGVCHSYTSKWVAPDVIPDPPVGGMWEFLEEAVKSFRVQIYSTRSETAAGRAAMQNWFFHHSGGRYHGICWMLGFPLTKPKAFVGLDDRILTFEGKWPSMEILRNWKPWNKREPQNG